MSGFIANCTLVTVAITPGRPLRPSRIQNPVSYLLLSQGKRGSCWRASARPAAIALVAGMLEEVVHGYREGLGQRSQCPGRAGAIPRLNLGKVNGIYAGGSGQLGLGHIAMVPIHPDWVLPNLDPLAGEGE